VDHPALDQGVDIGREEIAGGVGVAPPAPTDPAVLELIDIGKRFGAITALKGVSVTVREGEVLGIAGPNGSGKSTLFNVVAGVYRGTGHVLLRGEDIMALSPDRVCRRGVARTFQIPQVFATMTIEDNVRVGARFGGAPRHRTQELIDRSLEFVGLSSRRKVAAKHLDLLGRKLLMLAAALATEPFLLMLDEPMGGLTPVEIAQLTGLILKLRDEHSVTPIVIEHKVKTLVELSDRLMILFSGERIALGPPQEVVNDQQVVDLYLGKVTDVSAC
jgi:ABC-type branched-subunit amino acid transport system ATPase component